MKILTRYKVVVINLLIAAAISLIVNFSYLVLALMSQEALARRVSVPRMGSWSGAGYPPNVALQAVCFFVLAFVLLAILTRKTPRNNYLKRVGWCVAVTVVFFFLAPSINHSGEWMINALSHRVLSPMLILKTSFTLVVAVLYGKIFELVYQQQHMVLENELLKNENLTTRYNMLMNQINPHFFFNSLNSLAMLVRQKENDPALEYIDRLGDTFRYIIHSSQEGVATLAQELAFLESYKYLHEVRYAGKLFFDIEVDEALKGYLLPTLSLQPLIENAVKHNSITKARPFHISIATRGEWLVVSNPVIPKIGAGEGTGIGLQNLASRYQLLAGHDIAVEKADGRFTVRLPLIPPK